MTINALVRVNVCPKGARSFDHRMEVNVFSRSAAGALAGETSSDVKLINRIAAGDKLAMQTLFARHRTFVYRWLLSFVSND